jgi:hypothetical protein
VSEEGHRDGNRLADTGLRTRLRHLFPVGFVRQSLAALGQRVLPIGLVQVRSEVGPLARQMTAPAAEISGRPPLCRIDLGLGQQAPT